MSVDDYLLALGGAVLLNWIRNPTVPIYLWGPQGTGKSLFANAWKHVRPDAPQVLTGNEPARGYRNVKVAAPCTAHDMCFSGEIEFSALVSYLRGLK